MTLAEVCDDLELALQASELRRGYPWTNYVTLLIAHGELLWSSYGFHDEWRPKPEEIASLNRFNDLKARAKEAVK